MITFHLVLCQRANQPNRCFPCQPVIIHLREGGQNKHCLLGSNLVNTILLEVIHLNKVLRLIKPNSSLFLLEGCDPCWGSNISPRGHHIYNRIWEQKQRKISTLKHLYIILDILWYLFFWITLQFNLGSLLKIKQECEIQHFGHDWTTLCHEMYKCMIHGQ